MLFDIIPFDLIISLLNKLLIKANAKYGSLTIIGKQVLGRYCVNFSSIKHAFALVFDNSFKYLLLAKKDKSFWDEFRIDLIFVINF